MAQKFPPIVSQLVAHLKKLPGVGSRTAERFAFELLGWEEETLKTLSTALNELKEKAPPCTTCGCLADENICKFCAGRDTNILCLIGSAKDAYAIEETHAYRGLYHVIEHLISPLDGRTVQALKLDRIEKRIAEHGVKEVIIALDSTLEGDATALYLKNALAKTGLSVSRLAFGLPLGSSLEYVDGGTLARAFLGRH